MGPKLKIYSPLNYAKRMMIRMLHKVYHDHNNATAFIILLKNIANAKIIHRVRFKFIFVYKYVFLSKKNLF